MHDIETLIERSCTNPTEGVSISVRRSAFAALANHPNFWAALDQPICHPVVMLEPKAFLECSHWVGDIQRAILEELGETSKVLLLSFLTSDVERTEHFTGGGTTYDFVLHSATYKIIHAALGSWRT